MGGMKATKLTAESFHEFLSAQPYALIHFGAPWNAKYDEMTRRFMEGISVNVAFGEVDVDEPAFKKYAIEAHVLNIPALGLYVKGLHVLTIIGVPTKCTIDVFNALMKVESAVP